jgi:hypothetical protein
MSIEDVVRPAQSPPPAPGYRAPPTRGLNQDAPSATIGDDDAGTDTGPFARLDEINDFARFPALRKLLAGGQEIASSWRDVSGAFEIDPNVCGVWRLRVQSTDLALTFKALDALPAQLAGGLWANAVRVATVEVILDWQSAASGDRALTLADVRFPDSSAPVWTAAAGRDRLMVQVFSDGQLEGFEAGLNTGVPA